MNRYGKSYGGIKGIKAHFLENNSEHLASHIEVARRYSECPVRTSCKICGHKIQFENSLTKHSVPYDLCGFCGHLNGGYVETPEFLDLLYSDNLLGYANEYSSSEQESYDQRVEAIYLAKAEYLIEILFNNSNFVLEGAGLLDVGAGAGYFLNALEKVGFANCRGIEVSRDLVGYGNQYGKSVIEQIASEDLIGSIDRTACGVVSMIGVLEHVQNPLEVLEAVIRNNYVKYLYLSVPLFSLTVFTENIFENVAQRHLCGGHTHLFSDSSIDYLIKRFQLKELGRWYFGTDIADLIRSYQVELAQKNLNENLQTVFRLKLESMLDELQLVVDKKHFGSEIHLVLAKECAS